MARRFALSLALLLLIAGCQAPSAPPPPVVRMTGWYAGGGPTFGPEMRLTEDLPTFGTLPEWSGPYPFSVKGLDRPLLDGTVDEQALLPRLAAGLEATGKPDVPAALAGTLAGGHYVYAVGGYPKEGDDGPLVFMLHKAPAGWEATKICRGAWRWVWPGTQAQTHDPVVVCASIIGSGANLTLAAYAGDHEVLRFSGLADAALEVRPDPAGGPPTIVAYGVHHWLEWKGEPGVMERYTFAFKNGVYEMVAQERRADWNYHLARLIAFVAKDDWLKAGGEFATSPAGGVPAYLERNAPDLPIAARGTLTTGGRTNEPGRAWLRAAAGAEGGPWFTFAFDEQGRIMAVGQETTRK